MRRGPPAVSSKAPSASSAEADAGKALIALCEAELATDPDAARTVRLHAQMGWVWEHMLGDPRRAARHYEQALDLDPEHVPAIRAARRAHLANNRVRDALPLFDAEIRVTSAARDKAALIYEKGWWLEQLGDRALASEAYRAAVDLDPNHMAGLKALERLASAEQKWRDLAAIYGETANALRDATHRAALLVQRASIVESRAEDLELAAEIYESALHLDPHVVGALQGLERIYHATGRYRELISTLEREAERTGDPAAGAILLYNVARLQVERLGNAPEAITALEHARQASPRDPLILEDLARLYERADRPEPLADVLAILAELAPDAQTRVAVYHRLGRLYELHLGRPDDAIAAYRAALRITPTHVPSLQGIENLLRARAAWEDLLSVWAAEAEAATSDTQRARAHLRIALLADTELGDGARALTNYDRALALDPTNVPAFNALTRLFAAAGKHRELIELYERAINGTSSVARKVSYLFRIGSIHEDALEDATQAAVTYRRILKLEPDHLGAMHALARAAERAGQYGDVVEALEMEIRAITDPPHELGLLNRVGGILSDHLADPDGAAVRFRRALEIDPQNVTAIAGLGRIYHASGRWDDLLATYQMQIEGTPSGLSRSELLFKMGEIAEVHLGDQERAIGYYRDAIDATPGHDPSLRALGRILRERGDHAELAEILEARAATIRETVGKAQAFFRAGQVYEDQLGDSDAALKAYAAALRAHAHYRPAREALARLQDQEGAFKPLVALLDEESASTDPRGAAALMRQAEVFRDRLGDRDRAIASFEALLARDDARLAALLALEPLYAAGAKKEALAQLYRGQADSLGDPEARLAALKELARIQIKHDPELGPPRETLERIVSLAPGDPLALSLLERMAAKESDVALGSALDQRMAELATDPRLAAEHLASLAYGAEQGGQHARALDAYRAALAKDPDNLAAIVGLGRVAEGLGDHGSLAEARHREASFTNQPARAADLLVAEADLRLTKLGDIEAAVRTLERALKLCPDHEAAATRLTDLLVSQGAAEQLVDVLSNAANAATDSERVNQLWYVVGNLYDQMLGNLGSALTALQRALAARPDDVRTMSRLADLYRSNGQWNDAVALLDKVVALSLDDQTAVDAHLKLADLWANRLGDDARASQSLDAVIGLAPDHPQALGLLAEMQRKAGNLELALETVSRLANATKGRDRAAAFVRMARIERDRGNQEAYVQGLANAVRLEGADGEAAAELSQIVTTAHTAKVYADALAAFIAETAADGADVATYLELARVQADVLEMGETAIRTLGQGLEASRGAPAIAGELAKRLGQAGRYDDAVQLVQKALVANRTHVDLWRELSRILETGGRGVLSGLALAPLVALGRATDREQQAALAARQNLGRPKPGTFGRETLVALSEGAMSGTAMRLLEALLEPIAKLYPPDLDALGLSKRDRVTARSADVLRPLVDEAASAFGVREVEVYATDRETKMVGILPSAPPTLVLSRQLERLSEEEQQFLVSRAMAAVAGRFYPIFALSALDVTLLFAAVGHSVRSGFGTEVASAEELQQQAQRLRKTFSWLSSRKPLDEAAEAYVQAPVGNVAGWLVMLEQVATRAAALSVGDLPAAVQVLRREAGGGARSADPVGFVRGNPFAAGLFELWASGRAAQVLHHAGMLG